MGSQTRESLVLVKQLLLIPWKSNLMCYLLLTFLCILCKINFQQAFFLVCYMSNGTNEDSAHILCCDLFLWTFYRFRISILDSLFHLYHFILLKEFPTQNLSIKNWYTFSNKEVGRFGSFENLSSEITLLLQCTFGKVVINYPRLDQMTLFVFLHFSRRY